MINLIAITTKISSFSAIPALITGWKQKKLLWYYGLSSFLGDIFGLVIKHFNIKNASTTNAFFLVEFIFVSIYLIQNIKYRRTNRILSICATTLLFFFIVWTGKDFFHVKNFPGGAILNIYLIILVLVVLYNLLKNIETTQIEHSPIFIFCAGFLIYAAGMIIILLSRHYLPLMKHDPDYQTFNDQLRIVHHVLNTYKNGMLAYSLYLYKRFAN